MPAQQLQKLAAKGANIRLLTFTDGVGARDEMTNRNDRLDKVAEILGLDSYHAGNFPDNAMDSVALLKICKFIESNVIFDPDLIFTHHPGCLKY